MEEATTTWSTSPRKASRSLARFGSLKLPLVILTPTPLTLIGVVPGHRLFSAPFTAASIIGFIALAGTIVCNLILLVDFIRHGEGYGSRYGTSCWRPEPSCLKPIL
jgi:multidrug efflux pump subunit AcrB